MKTMSAHSICESFSRSTFKSISRRSQCRGNRLETVSKPNGGNTQRFPSNGSACRKLQYVSGNSGLTSKIFIASFSHLWGAYDYHCVDINDVRLESNLGRVIVL